MNSPMIYNDKDIDQTILKISSILLSLLCFSRRKKRKKRKRKSRYRNIGKRIRTLFDGGGWVMYWHVYVIVAICRRRKREKEGGESRGKVDGVWREREGVSSGGRGWTRNASRDCVEDVYLRVIAHGYPRSLSNHPPLSLSLSILTSLFLFYRENGNSLEIFKGEYHSRVPSSFDEFFFPLISFTIDFDFPAIIIRLYYNANIKRYVCVFKRFFSKIKTQPRFSSPTQFRPHKSRLNLIHAPSEKQPSPNDTHISLWYNT